MRCVRTVSPAIFAVSVCFGCSQNHNIPKNLQGVFGTTKGTVYSEFMRGATLPMPADMSEFVSRDSKLKGRALTNTEVAEVLALLHALDRVKVPAQTPGCAPVPQVVVRLEFASEVYLLPVDSKCAHIDILSPVPRRSAMVYGSNEAGFVDWARKIDRIAVSK